MTAKLKIEDVIRLFTSSELAGDQDFIIPKAANNFDWSITVGYSPRTTDKICFQAGGPKPLCSELDLEENQPSKPVVNDLNR